MRGGDGTVQQKPFKNLRVRVMCPACGVEADQVPLEEEHEVVLGMQLLTS